MRVERNQRFGKKGETRRCYRHADGGSRARDVTEILRDWELLQTCGWRVKGQGCNRNMERLGGVTNRGRRVKGQGCNRNMERLGGVTNRGRRGRGQGCNRNMERLGGVTNRGRRVRGQGCNTEI
jgi:hypothetical protein